MRKDVYNVNVNNLNVVQVSTVKGIAMGTNAVKITTEDQINNTYRVGILWKNENDYTRGIQWLKQLLAC